MENEEAITFYNNEVEVVCTLFLGGESNWKTRSHRQPSMRGKYVLRRIYILDMVPSLSLFRVVLNLTKNIVVRMHFLLKRKRRRRINHRSLPPMKPTKGRGYSIEKRRKLYYLPPLCPQWQLRP